ncbi:MAG TPA: HDIG domain-containing protein [Epulopiscium sp.]|nr:HDIG domain-containing protein [Candidatus Epulonipiscium sp.]
MRKQRRLSLLLLLGAVIISFAIIVTGRFVRETYHVEIGQVAPKTEYAPREIKNKVATEYKKDQIAKSLESQYVADLKVEEEVKKSVELLFDYIQAIQKDEDDQYETDVIEILQSRSTIPLYEEQYVFLLGLPSNARVILKAQIIDVIETVYKEGVTPETESKMHIKIEDLFKKTSLNPDQVKIGVEITTLVMRPNMIVDTKATEALIQETVDKVEPVMVLTGEKIIEQGTRITEETYELLKEAGFMKEEVASSVKRYIGAMIIVFLIAGMFFGYMLKKKSTIKLNSKEKTLVFVLYVISLLTLRVFGGISFIYIPMSIIPMLVAILINTDIGIVLNMILVVIGSLIYKGDIAYVLYFTITGIIGSLSVANIKQRSKTLSIAAYVGMINLSVIVGLRLFIQGTAGVELIVEGGGAFLMGILMLIVVVGSLPFWEIVFDIVTPIKLLELTNPDQEPLKRLLLEATGTYYHSLLVANLAETAANEVGANSLLARVGGYYHDIGKLGYVNYYKENQIGDNPHDVLEPDLSAQIIISHVNRGVELADQYKLPKCVRDIIAQHHGTGVAQYFYVKASNLETDEAVNIEDYQYKGPKPQTKEAAIVMLADVVEATVRSMMPLKNDEENIEAIVSKIVKGKLEEGQLDESELMLRDIERIIGAFSRLLVGMYHERITYPTKKEV